MMAASIRDVKLRSLELRCGSRGSLPFKKRRFDDVVLQAVDVSSAAATVPPQVSALSALSLIASTAAALPPVDETESSSLSESSSSLGSDQHRGLCQGRTSRTNARCKRPIYGGTGFCKLHFQLKGGAAAKASALEQEESSLTATTTTIICKPALTSSPMVPAARSSHGASSSSHDKRYQAGSGETRCQATTTRGRLCAYVATKGQKYCNLHCDFDTAPPPKRKKACDAAPNNKSEARKSSAAAAVLPEPLPDKVAPLERSSSGSKRSRGISKLAKKHMDSEIPVLSTISSDQWAKKRVKISVGPLAGRIGLVEKWSNGWVTVRVEGVGLHNRRSFELCLESEEKTTKKSASKKSTASNTRITPSPPVIGGDASSSAQAKKKPLRLKLAMPETPSTAPKIAVDWPITPATSNASDTTRTAPPLVPRVTPNSPRKAVTSSGPTEEALGEGLLLSDDATKGLQVRLGSGTAVPP